MALLNFQLKALQYPHEVDITNTELVRRLVIWLENQKIREYKIEDRKALSDIQSPGWDVAFKKYLQDLECPLPPGDMTAALHWLVAFAVNLEYEDNADEVAAVSSPPPAAAAAAGSEKQPATSGTASGGQDDQPFTDLEDPAVVAAVLQLISAARIETTKEGGGASSGATSSSSSSTSFIVDRLMAAAQRCVCEVGPALKTGVWSPGKPPRQALASVPLGFGLKGEALSTAATALRLLYIQDLRRLQSQIDHAVVEMQEYTANPRTDSSLGKVGH
ncbi:hypothetical protein VaNZ11_011766 [Volvox africanus]|uniref:Uncharacterized protein n=1 Tax=Volvox africanus TaxID=51714 RepID=A0ABQ5SC69_9CHLO|nr:hypothetical protein VaNZ11_011766 [Volvox africanus]